MQRCRSIGRNSYLRRRSNKRLHYSKKKKTQCLVSRVLSIVDCILFLSCLLGP